MNYWLFKSEPSCFSIDDLKHAPKKTGHWDGVRNYQVRNMLKNEMKRGDLVLFYHSSCTPPGAVGVMKIVKEGYPDHTAWDSQSEHYDPKSSPEKPLWYMVDVTFLEKFKRQVSLEEIKSHAALNKMLITRRGNRLSITPVTKKEFEVICRLGG